MRRRGKRESKTLCSYKGQEFNEILHGHVLALKEKVLLSHLK